MPKLEQIKQGEQQSPPKKQDFRKKILKLLGCLALLLYVFTNYIMPKLQNIPEIYAQSHFNKLFYSPHKKIVWLGADCPVSKRKKSAIEKIIKQTQLSRYYKQQPYLQNSLYLESTDTVGHFIIQNCSENICIIHPILHKLIQTNEQNLIQDMVKYVSEENWNKAVEF